jgi:hypothetical protein
MVSTVMQPSGVMARERTAWMLPVFDEIFTEPVRQGAVVATAGPAAHSLALALAAGPVQAGAWAAVVGLPTLGMQAAAELGLALGQLVAVPDPQPVAAEVLAAAIDGFDVLLIGPQLRLNAGAARRLQARAQSRGVLTVLVGNDVFSADMRLSATTTWVGLGEGHGVAQARRAQLELSGRRVHRPRRSMVWLPDVNGVLRVDSEAPAAVSDVLVSATVPTGVSAVA